MPRIFTIVPSRYSSSAIASACTLQAFICRTHAIWLSDFSAQYCLTDTGLWRCAGFLFLFLQNPHQCVPADLHGALRTELLTAEAADAFAAVNDRLFALHADRVRRTDLCTFRAADAIGGVQLRFRGQNAVQRGLDRPADRAGAAVAELDTGLGRDRLIIADNERRRISGNGQRSRGSRTQPTADGRLQRRHIVRLQTDERTRGQIQPVRVLRG